MKEIWRSIDNYPGYQVSNRGGVRRIDGFLPTIGRDWNGYPRVCLRKNGKSVAKTVHILVLEAFRGPRPYGHDSCHNDGSRTNNNLENLRWDTRRNNILDRNKHDTSNHGERNGRAVVDAKTVAEIRKKYKSGISGHKLLKQYKVSKTQMYRILNYQHWVPFSCEGTDI